MEMREENVWNSHISLLKLNEKKQMGIARLFLLEGIIFLRAVTQSLQKETFCRLRSLSGARRLLFCY